jgi:hypothetical protein
MRAIFPRIFRIFAVFKNICLLTIPCGTLHYVLRNHGSETALEFHTVDIGHQHLLLAALPTEQQPLSFDIPAYSPVV